MRREEKAACHAWAGTNEAGEKAVQVAGEAGGERLGWFLLTVPVPLFPNLEKGGNPSMTFPPHPQHLP